MSSSIIVKRISGGTTFKILFVGFLAFHIISTLVVFVLVMIGALPLDTTNPTVTELMTPILFLGAYLLVGVVLSPIWVGALWLSIWPGVWLYSLFRSMNLSYVPPDEQCGA